MLVSNLVSGWVHLRLENRLDNRLVYSWVLLIRLDNRWVSSWVLLVGLDHRLVDGWVHLWLNHRLDHRLVASLVLLDLSHRIRLGMNWVGSTLVRARRTLVGLSLVVHRVGWCVSWCRRRNYNSCQNNLLGLCLRLGRFLFDLELDSLLRVFG